MNKKQTTKVFNWLLIVVIVTILFIVIDSIHTVILETVDVLEDVPHIMDVPRDETFDIDPKIDLSDTMVFYNIEDSIRDEIQRFKYVDSLYKSSLIEK
jgi:hypothetical protein